jgi:hypothetical protein
MAAQEGKSGDQKLESIHLGMNALSRRWTIFYGAISKF